MDALNIYFSLFVTSFSLLIGTMVFGRFEEAGSLTRRLLRVFLFVGITGILHIYLGPYAVIFPAALFCAGMTFHIWWCRKNGINWWTAEPRAKYIKLRGWKSK